jgi:hypothetical protein
MIENKRRELEKQSKESAKRRQTLENSMLEPGRGNREARSEGV